MSSNPFGQSIRTFTAEFEPLQVAEHGAVAHVVVQIEAAAAPAKQVRQPLRLAIVIDRSGSMQGRPLQLASEAAQLALQLLRPQDEFCVVTFSDNAELLVDFGPASAERVAEALRRCQRIDSDASTHLSAGWRLGCQTLLATPLPPRVTALCLLLSDGHANRGETDREVLAEQARAMRISGVATSSVGLGRGVDEALLDGMARSGEGRFYFAERPEELREIFLGEIGDALQVVSPATTLELHARGPTAEQGAWQAVSSFRVQREGQPFALALGDLTSGQTLTLVAELQLPAGPAGQRLEYSAHLCDAEGQDLAPAVALELRRATPAELSAQVRDAARWRLVAEQRVHRARMRALQRNGSGDWDGAAEILLREAQVLRLLAAALRPTTADLEQRLEQEAELVRRQMDEMDRKLAYKEATYMSRSRDLAGASLKAMPQEQGHAEPFADLKRRP